MNNYILDWFIIISVSFALEYNGYKKGNNIFWSVPIYDSTKYATSTNSLREFKELNLPTDSVELSFEDFYQQK